MRPAPINNIRQAEIRQSPIHGLGLFAAEPLGAGVTLCVLDGQRVPWDLYSRTADKLAAPFIEWNALNPDLLLVRYFRTKYSYINHARQPNCVVRMVDDVLTVETLRAVRSSPWITGPSPCRRPA